MATGVDQHRIAFGDALQDRQHLLEPQGLGGPVIIGVDIHHEPGRGKDPQVVGPGGIAHPNRGFGPHTFDEIAAQPQGACTAGSVQRHCPIFAQHGVAPAKHQFAVQFAVLCFPGNAQIVLGFLLGQPHLLGPFYRFEHRIDAIFVQVDPDPQIDLVGVGVLIELLGEPEDGIGRGHLDS